MDTSKATARPWAVSDREIGGRPRVSISWVNENGEDCGTVAVVYSPNPDADGALIVRAVNSHEAMVRLLDAVEQWSGADPMVKGECFREVCERATQARAALALAEQG